MILDFNTGNARYEILSTATSVNTAGVISKAWYLDKYTNDIILVKGNTEDGYEPYSEVIVSRILNILNIEHIQYDILPKELFPEIKVYGGRVNHVSICKLYNLSEKGNIQYIPLWMFLEEMSVRKDRASYDYWGLTLKHINLDKLKEVLVLDAYVANNDRHLSNIEVHYKDNDNYEISIPFDFGASLGATVPIKKLLVNRGLDTSKPYKDTHREQIFLINRYSSHKISVPFSKEEFIEMVYDNTKDIITHLPEKRAELVRGLLESRLHYLDNLIIWKDEVKI